MSNSTFSYEPPRMVTNFYVRGFQYWDGATVLGQMQPGEELCKIAERDNPHDPTAIALYYESTKIGYVPSDECELLSTLLFYGHTNTFELRIQQVNPEADPWKQVRVGLYVVDAR